MAGSAVSGTGRIRLRCYGGCDATDYRRGPALRDWDQVLSQQERFRLTAHAGEVYVTCTGCGHSSTLWDFTR